MTDPVPSPGASVDARWEAWLVRGKVHERRVRRRAVVSAGALALAAATLYVFLR